MSTIETMSYTLSPSCAVEAHTPTSRTGEPIVRLLELYAQACDRGPSTQGAERAAAYRALASIVSKHGV